MILVVDSGSSVTQWACVREGMQVALLSTEGLNPLFADRSIVVSVVEKVAKWCDECPKSVFFYGAGCLSDMVSDSLKSVLSGFFPQATLCVESDMLGACRALLGNDAGLVGIMGTGSNVCYYNGCSVVRKSAATGYILGDEGSGNHIGRLLIKSYLDGSMPAEMAKMFSDRYAISSDQLYQAVYCMPFANRYLASFVPFVVGREDNPFIVNMLSRVFDDFFKMQVGTVATGQRQISLIGGVAMQFSNFVQCAAQRAGYEVDKILQEPIMALVNYHNVK